MICVPNFPGDADERLFRMQNGCYSEAVGIIVRNAITTYLFAESVLRCEGSMSTEVRELESFDHRSVQGVHDLIAAWYRFQRRTERLFVLEGNLQGEWLSFLGQEVMSLSREPDFVTGVLDACIRTDREDRNSGELRADSIQRYRYGSMFRYVLPSARPEEE